MPTQGGGDPKDLLNRTAADAPKEPKKVKDDEKEPTKET